MGVRVAAHSGMPLVTNSSKRRNTKAKPSYHWNSLIVRSCHRRRKLIMTYMSIVLVQDTTAIMAVSGVLLATA